MIVDRIFEDARRGETITRLDLKVCFRTGGCLLLAGVDSSLYEHWRQAGKRRNFRRRREKWRRKTEIKTEIA